MVLFFGVTTVTTSIRNPFLFELDVAISIFTPIVTTFPKPFLCFKSYHLLRWRSSFAFVPCLCFVVCALVEVLVVTVLCLSAAVDVGLTCCGSLLSLGLRHTFLGSSCALCRSSVYFFRFPVYYVSLFLTMRLPQRN